MNVGSVGIRSRLAVQTLADMRRQLDDLQRQLGTGKKATTHAGIGLDRSLAVGLRTQLAGLQAYGQTMTMLDMRLELAQLTLGRIDDIRQSAKSSLLQNADIKANGQTAAQESARNQLDELLELLNTQAGERYLFGGRAVDQRPVESAQLILEGDGARAGFKQIIAERALADLGATGLGRLDVTRVGPAVTVAEDAAGSPFGFKLAAVDANLTGATVTGPTGSPPGVTVNFAANPNSGETITLTLKLPDGTQETITLAATTSATPTANEFSIGIDGTATATNIEAALTDVLGARAETALAAASTLAAADDFFGLGAGDPPLRVAGPPFDSATTLVAGTAGDTVSWYKGELNSDPPRASAVARIDAAVTVGYGMRANEEGIRWVVQNVAAFAAVTFDPNAASSKDRYAELTDRLQPALAIPPSKQSISDISADLAGAQTTIAATQTRREQSGHALATLLDQIEGVPAEEVATQILALQTRLQASLQTTALLYQLNLADYI